ncbi:hypothetical protein HanIR_Chr01g0010951 [Helianthus annuus]|nr:hypothetical protein HanIR_Chr01g0010951 [Helianthus annuus]
MGQTKILDKSQLDPYKNTHLTRTHPFYHFYKIGSIPISKLHGALGLDCSNTSIDIFGNDVSTEHQTTSHMISMPGIAFSHHACRL